MNDDDEKWLAVEKDEPERFVNAYARASQPGHGRGGPMVAVSHLIPDSALPEPISKPSAETAAERAIDPTGPLEPCDPEQVVTAPAGSKDAVTQEAPDRGSVSALMTIPEVAAYLNVSISKVHRLRRGAPDFPQPVDLPGRVTRWVRDDVNAFVERRRIG